MTTGQNLSEEKRVEIAHTILKKSAKCKFNEGLTAANFFLAKQYFVSSPEKSLIYCKKVDSILKIENSFISDTAWVGIKIFKGRVYGRLGNPVLEIENYYAANDIAESNNNLYLQASVNKMLYRYYLDKDQFEKARVYYSKAVAFFAERLEDKKNKYSYLLMNRNWGIAHYYHGDPDSCIFYINKSIDEGLGKYINPSISYIFLGQSYLKKENLTAAKRYIDLAEEFIDIHAKGTRVFADFNALNANYQLALKNYEEAISYYQKAFDIYDKTLDFKGKEEATIGILKVNFLRNERKDLFERLKTIINMKDSLHDEKVFLYEQQMMIQLETNKKEAEISRLTEENLKKRNQITLIVTGSLIFVLVFLLLLFRYRAKRKRLANQLEKEKLSKAIANSELEKSMESLKVKTSLVNQLKLEMESQDVTSISEMSILLDKNYVDDADWAAVKLHFEKLNKEYMTNVYEVYPQLKQTDIRLLILVNLGYTNKGIADINSITESGVKKSKQRLRQKMNVDKLPTIND